MTEDTTAIVNSLIEFVTPRIRIPVNFEQQRVSTPFADVFVVCGTRTDRDVMMTPEKTCQRMGDSRNFVPAKDDSVTTNALRVTVPGDGGVINLMAQQSAAY